MVQKSKVIGTKKDKICTKKIQNMVIKMLCITIHKNG